MPPEWQDHHDIERGWLLEIEARLDAANAAFQRMLAEAEPHRGEDGFIDFQRLVVAPTEEWVAAEDAMVDTALCSKTAVQICEALDALLIMGAVTGRTGSWEPLLRVVHGQKSGMRTNDYCTETNQEAVWWQARWECGCCNAHGSSPLQQQAWRSASSAPGDGSESEGGSSSDTGSWEH